LPRFVSFDGNKTFYNVDQIFSVTEGAPSFASALHGTTASSDTSDIYFVNGRKMTLQMNAAQAMYLIRSAS
jgi:hypothetical protein